MYRHEVPLKRDALSGHLNSTLVLASYDPKWWAGNCATATDFIASVFRHGFQTARNHAWMEKTSYPYAELVAHLRTIDPALFRNVSRGNIVDWVDSLEYNLPQAGAILQTIPSNEDCKPQLCAKLEWEGNADLTGIGVFISYIIEIVIATAFVLLFSYFYTVGRKPRRLPINSKAASQERTWVAIQASVGIFWDSALLFALAITTGALVVTFNDKKSPYYSQLFATLSSNMAASVVVITWPFYKPTCRYPNFRVAALCAVCILCAIVGLQWQKPPDDNGSVSVPAVTGTVTRMNPRPNPDGWWDWDTSKTIHAQDTTSAFEIYCLYPYGYRYDIPGGNGWSADPNEGAWLDIAIPISAGSVLGIPFALLVLPTILSIAEFAGRHKKAPGAPSSPDSKFVVRILKLRHGVLGAAWMCTFMWMWMSFGAFVHYHYRVAARAGPTLTESQMGFGQVLALATWLPTLLDFAVIWKGHLKNIVYRLPLGVELESLLCEESALKNASEVSLASPASFCQETQSEVSDSHRRGEAEITYRL